MNIIGKKIIMKLMFLLVFGLVCNVAMSQTKIVRGTISDADDKSFIPGATVVELDKDNRIVTGTVTDFNGNYAITMKSSKNRLSFSFIGYVTVVLEVGDNNRLDVALGTESTMIEDIKVVAEKRGGDGISNIAIRDMGVPMSTMDMKDVEGVQANSVDEALQGRLTGVDIAANSGDPGAGMAIKIRGTSTLNANSKPLIVVDNVPYNVDISAEFDFGSEDEEGYADLLNLAPEDIKEIAVLKDASATAMWGTKAANGVLLITTKRGARKKPTIAYTHKSTFTFKVPSLPMLNGDQYSTMILEGYLNNYGYPLNTTANKEFLYDPTDPYWYYNYSNNTNWYDETNKNSYQHTHNLNLNGGGEKVAYNFSLNYKDQQGVMIGTGFRNLATRLNLDYNVSEKIKVRTDFVYSSGLTDRTYDKYLGSKVYTKMPNMGVYEYDEFGNQTPVYFSPEYNIQGRYSSTYNPVAMAKEGVWNVGSDELISNFSIDYRIIPSLFVRSLISYKVRNSTDEKFLPQIASGVNITNLNSNSSYEYDNDYTEVYTDSKVLYEPNLGENHKFTSTFQVTTFQGESNSFASGTYNSASSLLQDVIHGSYSRSVNLGSQISEHRNMGLLMLLHYKYKDRYILTSSIRREGNSRFNKKYRFGDFKSVSLSYRLSEEPFMKQFKFLDDMKISGSWGENGNAPRYEYLYYNRYSSYDWTYLGQTGVYPSSMQLDNLKWESIVSQNLRLDLAMFDNRINFTGDLYRRRTKDLLSSKYKLPSSSGQSMITSNIGDIDNQGWEISFNAVPVKTKNFIWNINFNISRNSDIWRKVTENVALETGITTKLGEYKWLNQIDNPIGSFYGYKFKGVYKDQESTIALDKNGNKIFDANGKPIQMVFDYPNTAYQFQPGDAMYEDVNHDGNINYMDVVYLGNINPDFFGGLGTSFSYKKNLSFNFFFNYRYGSSIINRTRMETERMYGYDNQSTSVLRRWRNEGDVTDIPRALLGGGYNWLGSDRYVEDGSFIRLRYITVRYQVPKSFAKKLAMKNLSFMTTVNNIFTWTNYKGLNPDISSGIDKARTPVAPSATFTVSMTF